MGSLSAFITGCASTSLSAAEQAFFAEVQPAGLILFARNCETPDQVRGLVNAFHNAVGSDQPFVLVDQEGGRVQRLQPPHWRALPSARSIAQSGDGDLKRAASIARAVSRVIAHDLLDVGITVNCAPVADLPVAGAHAIIGDRAYGREPEAVALLARAAADGLLDAGVLPVLKHIPGHGRATSDSHEALPVIDTSLETLRRTDFIPFARLADLPLAMTAHVLLTAVDREHPVSVSPDGISNIIRDEIGFQGLLMSDDLSMEALQGDVGSRARDVIVAGCDLALHCNGRLAEMQAVAANVPLLDGAARRRFDAALTLREQSRTGYDLEEALAGLNHAMTYECART